jgi:hypothetical protein
MYISRMCSRLQPLTSRSGTRPAAYSRPPPPAPRADRVSHDGTSCLPPALPLTTPAACHLRCMQLPPHGPVELGYVSAECRYTAASRPTRCRVSKNLRTRSQADADYGNGLFDTSAGPTASSSSLSKKRALFRGSYPYSDTCRTWSSITKVCRCVKHHFSLSLATGKPRFYVGKFGHHTKVTL